MRSNRTARAVARLRQGPAAVLVALGVLVSAPAAAQTVFPPPSPPDPAPFQSSEFALAIAMLNIGCGSAVLPLPVVVCQDRGTQFGRLLAIELASYPVSAPTGGFSLTFDPRARAYVRGSSSFGPSFAERPLTNGRHILSVGFSSQHTSFDALDGIDLHGIVGQSEVIERPGEFPGAEVAMIDLALSSETSTFFAAFGVTSRLDVGVVVPYKRIDFSGQQMHYSNDCSSTIGINFAGACTILGFTQPLHRVATGVGDVTVRAKYQWLSRDNLHLGTTLDVSFPTGAVNDFLGTGKISTKGMLLVSTTLGALSPHLNLGYTDGGNSLQSVQSSAVPGFTERSREISFVGGVEASIGTRLTVTSDVLSKRLLDIGHLQRTTTPNTLGTELFVTTADEIVGNNQQLTLVSVGFKLNVTRTYLLKGDVLLPVNYNGLHSRWTPVLGIDYTF
jgi:hypothetical protein